MYNQKLRKQKGKKKNLESKKKNKKGKALCLSINTYII